MSEQDIKQFVIIPDPDDAKKVAGIIKEIDNAMMMIEAKRDFIKEAKKVLKEYELTPKSIQTLISLYHKQNAEDHFQEQDEMHMLYERVFPETQNDENEDGEMSL